MMDFNEDEYLDIEQRQEVRNKARMFRRKYIRYKEAEWIYSMRHLSGSGRLSRDNQFLIPGQVVQKCLLR